MGSQETQSRIAAAQQQLDGLQLKLSNEQSGFDRQIERLQTDIQFNQSQADSILQNGGDEQSAQSFSSSAEQYQSQLTQAQTTQQTTISSIQSEISSLEGQISQLQGQLESEKKREDMYDAAQRAAGMIDQNT